MNLACIKYQELVEDIESLNEREKGHQKGKGSLDLKIDKKLQDWKDSYLYSIRSVLQKYSRGIDCLQTYKEKIGKLDALLADIDYYEQWEDGQVQLTKDEGSAQIIEQEIKVYLSARRQSVFAKANKTAKKGINTQPVLQNKLRRKTRNQSEEEGDRDLHTREEIVSSKKLRQVRDKKPKTTRRKHLKK